LRKEKGSDFSGGSRRLFTVGEEVERIALEVKFQRKLHLFRKPFCGNALGVLKEWLDGSEPNSGVGTYYPAQLFFNRSVRKG
jgi:hypothetical protein